MFLKIRENPKSVFRIRISALVWLHLGPDQYLIAMRMSFFFSFYYTDKNFKTKIQEKLKQSYVQVSLNRSNFEKEYKLLM
jgi:hypothetical protein